MNFIIWGGLIGAIFSVILSTIRPNQDISALLGVIGFGIIGAIAGILITLIITVISILKFFVAEGAQLLL